MTNHFSLSYLIQNELRILNMNCSFHRIFLLKQLMILILAVFLFCSLSSNYRMSSANTFKVYSLISIVRGLLHIMEDMIVC
jgi:hypothetical protein